MDAAFFLSVLEIPSLGEGRSGALLYLALSAFGFALLGFVVGYFIWRKGDVQTLDAEIEVHRSAVDLDSLREELQREKAELGDVPDREP